MGGFHLGGKDRIECFVNESTGDGMVERVGKQGHQLETSGGAEPLAPDEGRERERRRRQLRREDLKSERRAALR